MMRVLVVGTLPSGAEHAAEQVRRAGHDVVLCHLGGDAPFPCAALDEARGCPLETETVDVVLTARNRPWPRPSPLEDGVTCALRRHVPLVVAGGAQHPFAAWATEEISEGDDLVAACERAASAPLRRHAEVATASAKGVLERAGVPGDVSAVVRRSGSQLHAEVALPDHARKLDAKVSVKVIGDLRAFDHFASGIDVSIVTA